MALWIAEKASLSDVGRQRSHNEDAYLERPPVFAVADGMGGARAGEVASRIAVEALAASGDADTGARTQLVGAAEAANRQIHELAAQDVSRTGMGTTLTAAIFSPKRLTVGHIGDSRLYRLRAGELTRLTDDHSLVAELVRRGELTAEEARHHPARSMLLRALGPEPQVEIDSHHHSVRDGDVYLICSDGLTGMVPEAEIASLLERAGSLAEAARALVDAANGNGGLDNVTVVLFRLAERAGEPAATVPGATAVRSRPT